MNKINAKAFDKLFKGRQYVFFSKDIHEFYGKRDVFLGNLLSLCKQYVAQENVKGIFRIPSERENYFTSTDLMESGKFFFGVLEDVIEETLALKGVHVSSDYPVMLDGVRREFSDFKGVLALEVAFPSSVTLLEEDNQYSKAQVFMFNCLKLYQKDLPLAESGVPSPSSDYICKEGDCEKP